MMKLKFDVFGQLFHVEKNEAGWVAYNVGNDGKRSPTGLPIPPDLEASGIARFLDDIYHESATTSNPEVRLIE